VNIMNDNVISGAWMLCFKTCTPLRYSTESLVSLQPNEMLVTMYITENTLSLSNGENGGVRILSLSAGEKVRGVTEIDCFCILSLIRTEFVRN
jgi:hypothetical protein